MTIFKPIDELGNELSVVAMNAYWNKVYRDTAVGTIYGKGAVMSLIEASVYYIDFYMDTYYHDIVPRDEQYGYEGGFTNGGMFWTGTRRGVDPFGSPFYIKNSCFLDADTYDFIVHHGRLSGGTTVEWFIDGVSFGTTSFAYGVTEVNGRSTITGVVVPTSGWHTVIAKVAQDGINVDPGIASYAFVQAS